MDFRNLHGFNLLMLGKQCWKFFSSPDALMSRIFKAKYFPHGYFLLLNLVITQVLLGGSIRISQALINCSYRWREGG